MRAYQTGDFQHNCHGAGVIICPGSTHHGVVVSPQKEQGRIEVDTGMYPHQVSRRNSEGLIVLYPDNQTEICKPAMDIFLRSGQVPLDCRNLCD